MHGLLLQLPATPRRIVSSSRGVSVVEQSGSPAGHEFRAACDGKRQSSCPAKLDAFSWFSQTHTVVTGSQPRSMAISSDGTAIYVANYDSSTVTKLDAATMEVLDEHPTDHHPIGITYEPTTRSVWVAAYGGSIQIFSDG